MTYKLYLDDIRNPPCDDFVVVRSFHEATAYVKKHGFPQYVSLDHDLGEAEIPLDTRTGYDFAKWLVEQDMRFDTMPLNFAYNVHSANPVGAANIRHYMDCYLRNR